MTTTGAACPDQCNVPVRVIRPGAARWLAGWPVMASRPGGACSVILRTESATTEMPPG